MVSTRARRQNILENGLLFEHVVESIFSFFRDARTLLVASEVCKVWYGRFTLLLAILI